MVRCNAPSSFEALAASGLMRGAMEEHLPCGQERFQRSAYREAVTRAVAHIRSGGLRKVVLARPIEVDLQGLAPEDLFAAACERLPGAFVALVHTPQHGLWIGASPERLLSLRDGRIEVDALAGTMEAASAPEHTDAWGAKEREEQALVTEAVLRALSAAGAQGLMADGPRVKRAGNLAHLHTVVSGVLHADAHVAARWLHPTPAVGGEPRDAALSLIAELEPFERGLYAGYWGPVERDRADLYVNIRCMRLFHDRAVLYAGAGITAASDPDAECDEVERKAGVWLGIIEGLRGRG
jgi:isochorismate synthase